VATITALSVDGDGDSELTGVRDDSLESSEDVDGKFVGETAGV